jgi:hypothetical protein
MYFSASTSGVVHVVIVAASLFSLPAIELAFGDRFGRGPAQDVLSYGEADDFQSKFTSGALTERSEDADDDKTVSGLDTDDSVNTDSSGEFGFNEAGDAEQTDSRRAHKATPISCAACSRTAHGRPLQTIKA